MWKDRDIKSLDMQGGGGEGGWGQYCYFSTVMSLFDVKM